MQLILFINIARLHPLLVHLPIGMLMLTFALELANRYWKKGRYDESIVLGLILSVVMSIMTTVTGFLLANEGGYGENALSYHKYAGIALTLASLLTLFSRLSKSSKIQSIYFPLFSTSIGLLFLTGHLGGNLTHGSDYLFSTASDDLVVLADINEANAYQDIIRPIIKSKCNGCHNPSKLKGELLMTTPEGLMKGGENGAIFNFDNPEQSEIIKRVHLPKSDEAHMPPDGKTQLSGDEIAILEWWTNNKACFDCKVAEMDGTDSIRDILDKYATPSSESARIQVEALNSDVLLKLNSKGIKVQPISADDPYVSVSFLNDTKLSKSKLKTLSKVKRHIVELDLSGSSLSNSMFKSLPTMPNLEKLQLQRTPVDDEIANKIKSISGLKSLNLYATNVTDQTLEQLPELKVLQQLYLYQSKVTDAGVAQLQDNMPLLNIEYKIDKEIFGDGSLAGPSFENEVDLFVDSMTVTLQSTFRNVTIHYTTDGSQPDSLSPIYENPLLLTETTLIRAICRKSGWQDSPISEKHYIQTEEKAKYATLSSPPDGRYAGRGASTIIDLVKGSEDFRDGHWLGYEGQDMVATLELENPTTIENIFVSTLSEPGSWIFYPKSIKVSLSQDGKNFSVSKLAGNFKDHRVGKEISYLEIPIQGDDVRYVKVEIENIKQNPDWHPNPGGKSWLFVDEIMIN